MKRSREIHFIGLLSAVALSTLGCSDRNTELQRCVDQNGIVVADEQCQKADQARASGGGFYPFLWYYGGRGMNIGDRVSAGSYRPTPGKTVVRSSTRGGFGSSSRSVVS